MQQGRRVYERLDRCSLCDRADPMWAAAVKAEVVFPRNPARARHGEAECLREQSGEIGAVVLIVEPIRGTECTQPLHLDSLPGVVLPHEVAVGEADALPVGQKRSGRPPLRVLLQREDQLWQSRGGQGAAVSDSRERARHRAELCLARAAKASDRRSCCAPRGHVSGGGGGGYLAAHRQARDGRGEAESSPRRGARHGHGGRVRGRRVGVSRAGAHVGAGHDGTHGMTDEHQLEVAVGDPVPTIRAIRGRRAGNAADSEQQDRATRQP